MGTIDTLIRVKADAAQAVRGLKPLQVSLEETAHDAVATEKALNDLGSGSHSIKVNDTAIANARAEITRLRTQMRQDLSVDVHADTRAAQAQIGRLQRTIRVLDSETVSVPVVVTGVEQAEGRLASMNSSLSGAAGSVKGIGGAIVGSAVAKWMLDGAVGAAEFETNMRSVNAVLGETVQIEVGAWIDENAEGLNLSQVAAGELARSLTIAAKSFQSAGGDAGDFLINMEKITAETAAFSGADPGSVAEAIGAAFRGEFDSLQTFGINLNAARVEAQAFKDGMIQNASEMTPAITTQATYNAILEESATVMGSVDRNAGTTKGSIDALKSSVKDLSTSFGSTLGPTLQGVADLLNVTSDLLDSTVGKYNEFRDKIVEGSQPKEDEHNFLKVLGGDIALLASGSWDKVIEKSKHEGHVLKTVFGDLFDGADDAGDKIEDFGESVHHQNTFLSSFSDKVGDVADAQQRAADAAEVHEASIKRLHDRVEQTSDAFEDLMADFTATNDAMISARTGVYDYEAALDDLTESLKESNTFSPDSEEGRKNWDNLVSFAESASTRVENALKNRGADAANQIFDSSRNAMAQMLIDAGVGADKAWALVDQVFKKPVNMKIHLDKAELKRLDEDLARLRNKRRRIEEEFARQTSGPISADAAERLGVKKDALLAPIQQQINIDVTGKQETLEELDGLTKDERGRDRKAQVNVVVPQREIDEANAAIDGIIKLRRTAEIKIDIVPPDTPIIGGFPFGTGTPFVPRTSAAPGAAEERRPTPSRREKVDVSVYMDGRLVGNVPGRVNRGGSGRRRP